VKLINPLLIQLGIDLEDIAFIGNEIMDIGLMEKSGLGIAVADSARDVIDVADFVTRKAGGQGAVREVLEYYFEAVGKDPKSYLK
jgi:YrbI family 3-deoxy-D-manno-octulosonate 8-phosphate phosphatase